MTNQEFITHVTEELDKVGSPYFDDQDLLRRAKESTYKLIEELFPMMENDQEVRGELNFLVGIYTSTSPIGDVNYLQPSDFFRLLSLAVKYNDDVYPGKIVQANDFQKLNGDPFNSPTQDYPLCVVTTNGFEVHPEPTSLIYKYLKTPSFGNTLNSDFVQGMGDSFFYKVANDVIRGAMATTGDERYQLKSHQSSRQ